MLPRILAAALALLAPASLPAQTETPEYDLVIRGGRVLDGAGNPWVRADVAIRDGRFVRIGQVPGKGRREIDANGRYVSPGWIDAMDQSGATLLVAGMADNKVRAGVTTLIAGENGTPVGSAELPAYFARLERSGLAVNFGTLYGAAQARVLAMGDIAGHPTAAQLDVMKADIERAMRAGALGIGTALVYPPASFQTTGDLVALARVAARYDGIYATHMRDEAEDLLKGVAEAIEIGERSGAAVQIFHLKAAFQPGWGKLMPEAGRLIEAARSRGLDIAADMYLYPFSGTGLVITVPNWVFEKGNAEGMRLLADPAVRARLKREVAAGSMPGWSNFVTASGGWGGVILGNAYNPEYDRYRGLSLEEVGRRLGRDPADVAWDIVLGALPNRAMAMFRKMSEGDLETAMRFPWIAIGSDAGSNTEPHGPESTGNSHPRGYGNAPRLIAEYVKRRGVLTLEEAVRKMTSWPASRYRLFDRGVIRLGAWADVTIFDLDRIDDKASITEPTATPEGIDWVIVNGQIVLDRGERSAALPGKLLYGAGRQTQ